MTSESTPRRLLVLVHEFPPAGGAGVQRIAKFCKYLPEFGWSPEVISTEMIEGRPTDPTLVADVEGVPVTRLAHRDVATSVARVLAPLKRRGGDAKGGGGVTGAGAAPDHVRQPMSARIAHWIAVPDGASRWAKSAARTALDPRLRVSTPCSHQARRSRRWSPVPAPPRASACRSSPICETRGAILPRARRRPPCTATDSARWSAG